MKWVVHVEIAQSARGYLLTFTEEPRKTYYILAFYITITYIPIYI